MRGFDKHLKILLAANPKAAAEHARLFAELPISTQLAITRRGRRLSQRATTTKHSLPKTLIQQEPGLGRWCILSAYRGSIAHGMYLPGSSPTSIDDKDVMAVCVPPAQFYLGLAEYGSRGTVEVKQGPWDIVIYEIRKMMKMLLEGNPNVLSLLWVDPKHHLTVTEAGSRLIRSRKLFVGRHVYHSFAGYAQSQLKRMTHLAFKGYMGEKRKRLVERFGYDTKNAAHLIRLLRMCIEFLEDGELRVERLDAAELLAIKQGQWTLERVQADADRLFKQAKRAYRASRLPEAPNRDRVNTLCVKIVQTAWKTQGRITNRRLGSEEDTVRIHKGYTSKLV